MADNRLVFWVYDGSGGNGPFIERANQDGSNRTVLVQTGLTKPTGLAMNHDGEQGFTFDFLFSHVKSVSFHMEYGGSRRWLRLIYIMKEKEAKALPEFY